jgi:hypothetical protein
MIERIPSTGSCHRCQGALGLTAVKRDGHWFCSAACAAGEPTGSHEPTAPEPVLWSRPHRFFRRRLPKELNAAAERPSR